MRNVFPTTVDNNGLNQIIRPFTGFKGQVLKSLDLTTGPSLTTTKTNDIQSKVLYDKPDNEDSWC